MGPVPTRSAARCRALVLLLFVLALPLAAAQQDPPRLSARLSSGVVNLGATATVVVEVTGTDRAQIVGVPQVDGLTLVDSSGPSLKQATSLIGRTVQRSVSISWVLRFRPTRAGEFVLPPIRLEVDGRPAQTEELVLRVVEDMRGEELGHFELLEAPRQVYEGEPFTIELRFGWDENLHGRINHANLILPWWNTLPGLLALESPAQPGLRRVEVQVNSRGRLQVEELGRDRVRGGDFRLYRLRRSFVATRTGTLEFPTSSLEFGRTEYGFLRDTHEYYYVHVPAFAVEVRPLPEAGRPLDFSGGVGRFEASASADRRDVDVGESIKLTVEWTGPGNLEFFQAPDLSRLEAFRGFRFYGSTDRYRDQRRTVVYDLAPESSDLEELPGVPLSVFDTAEGAYAVLRTRPIPIRVRPLGGDAELGRLGAEGPAEDLRDLQSAPEPSALPAAPGDGVVAGALALLPLAWIGLRHGVRRRGDPAAPAERRRRAARRRLRRELAGARGAGEQSAALARFLAARSGESAAAWEGRDPLQWRAELAERARPGARLLEIEEARALAEIQEALAERRWAGDDAPLAGGDIERLADRLLAGGL